MQNFAYFICWTALHSQKEDGNWEEEKEERGELKREEGGGKEICAWEKIIKKNDWVQNRPLERNYCYGRF